MSKKVLSLTDIITGQPVQAAQVTQSVNAFTGAEDYSIVISGSLETTTNSPTTLGGDLLLTDNVSAISQSNFTASAGGGGNVLLKYNKSEKLATSATGVTVTGDVNTTTLNVGSITASANVSIAGGLSATDITASGTFLFAGDLDVTNITASGDINVGTIYQSNFTASAGGAGNVFLKYGEVDKLVTSATGVTVTGEVNATSVDASGTITSATGVLTDIISEKTTNAGVTIEGVLVKDNDIVATDITTTNLTTTGTATALGGVFTDTITETTGNAGVTIEGTLLKDNDVTTTDLTTTNNVIAGSSVLTDTITEKTAAAGVTVEGVLMKDNNVTVSSPGIFSGDGSGLTNIPSSAIQPITFNQIVSGLATASIAPTLGLRVQTNNAGSITFLPTTTSALSVLNNTDISPDASGNGQLKIQGNGYAGYIALDGDAMNIGNNSGGRDLRFQTNEIDRLTITQTKISSSVPVEINQQLANNADALVIRGAGSGGSVKGVVHIGMTNFSGTTLPGVRISAEENNNSSYLTNLLFSTRGTNSNTAPIERMRISNNGNVGIGTIIPLEKLDVNGVLRIAPTNISATQTGIILKDPGSGANEGLNILWQSASDTNTAFIGGLAYDQLRIGTAGAERIRINGSGNVGIGTTNPTEKLVVSSEGAVIKLAEGSSGGSTPDLTTATYDEGLTITGGNQRLVMDVSDVTNGGSYIQSRHASTSFPTAVYNLALNPLGGNVGIGTSTPNAELDIQGANVPLIKLTETATGGKNILLGVDTSNGFLRSSGNMLLQAGSSYQGISILESGNVGIGAAAPSTKLEVAGSIMAAQAGKIGFRYSSGNPTFYNYITANGASYLNLVGGQFTTTPTIEAIRLEGNGAESTISLLNSGNVGIGETIPVAYDSITTKFHVKAKSVASGTVAEVARFEGGTDSSGGGGTIRITNSNDRGTFIEGGRTGTIAYGKIGTTGATGNKVQNIFLAQSGAVGIGTSTANPAATLDVAGSIRLTGASIFSSTGAGTVMTLFDNNSTRNNRIVLGANASGAFINSTYSTGGTQNLILNAAAGNVGIGTTSPSHKLEVNGDTAIAAINGATTNGKPMLFIGESNAYGVGFRWNSSLSLDIMDFDNVTPTSTSGTKIGHFEIRNEEFYWKGNVGIGLTNPSAKLHISNPIDGTLGSSQIRMSADSNAATYGYLTMVDNTVNTAKLTLGTTQGYGTPIDAMTIYNGQVGIGTTSPDSILDVVGADPILTVRDTSTSGASSHATLRLAESDGGGNVNIRYDMALDAGNLTFDYSNGTTTKERMRIDSNGKVNIGINDTMFATTAALTVGVTPSGASSKSLVASFGSAASGILSALSLTNSSAFATTGYGTALDFHLATNFSQTARIAALKEAGASADTGLAFSTYRNSGGLGEAMRITHDKRVGIGTSLPSTQLQLSLNSASKPSSNQWTITSDKRVKTNIKDYKTGLEAILKIEPKLYDYNGKAGFEKTKNNIGIIAQDMQKIMPETINTYKAKLNKDDKEDTELLHFDGHAVTFALINSIKELKAEIEQLKKQINNK